MKLSFWFQRGSALAICLITLVLSLPARAQDSPMQQAMGLFYAQKFDEAISAFNTIVKKEPANSLAMSYLLDAYYRKKDINTIINQIEQEAVSKGEDPTAQAHLGMAYFLRGMLMPNSLDEALTEFKNALKDDPKLSLAYTGVGMVYFQKRMMPRAKGYFIRALRINPHDVLAMDLLGNIMLVDEKKPDEALQLYQRTVAELPTYPDGHYYVGSSLYDLKRFDEAIPYLTTARNLDPPG